MTKIIISLGVLALLFAIPITRAILILVLPLGSGVDDLFFLVGVILIGSGYLIHWLMGRSRRKGAQRREHDLQLERQLKEFDRSYDEFVDNELRRAKQKGRIRY